MTSKMPPVPKDQRSKLDNKRTPDDDRVQSQRDDPKGTAGDRDNIRQNTTNVGNQR